MVSVKQGGIKYHFLSLWYDSTWDWTSVSWFIGEYFTHYANGAGYIYIYNQVELIERCSLTLSLSVFIVHSLLAGLLDCIQCPYKVDVCKSLMVGLQCHIHKRTSLIGSSLLLQQGPAYLVHATWMACEMRGQMAIQLMFCEVLFPGSIQNCT